MRVNANKQCIFHAELHGYAGNCRRFGLNICLTVFLLSYYMDDWE